MGYTLVEAHAYTSALAGLGDLRRLDDALRGVAWALATKPAVYPEVANGVRVLKTAPLGGLPPFVVRFRIDDDREEVELLHVEAMDFDGDWIEG
jgi:hypothetical protein